MSKGEVTLCWVTLVGVVVILACCFAVGVYSCSVQSEVYRREGIEVSTWEVWCGARPAERAVTIKNGGER